MFIVVSLVAVVGRARVVVDATAGTVLHKLGGLAGLVAVVQCVSKAVVALPTPGVSYWANGRGNRIEVAAIVSAAGWGFHATVSTGLG